MLAQVIEPTVISFTESEASKATTTCISTPHLNEIEATNHQTPSTTQPTTISKTHNRKLGLILLTVSARSKSLGRLVEVLPALPQCTQAEREEWRRVDVSPSEMSPALTLSPCPPQHWAIMARTVAACKDTPELHRAYRGKSIALGGLGK